MPVAFFLADLEGWGMYNRVECIEIIGVFIKSQKNKTKNSTMIRVWFRCCGCAALPLYAFGGDQVNGTIETMTFVQAQNRQWKKICNPNPEMAARTKGICLQILD